MSSVAPTLRQQSIDLDPITGPHQRHSDTEMYCCGKCGDFWAGTNPVAC